MGTKNIDKTPKHKISKAVKSNNGIDINKEDNIAGTSKEIMTVFENKFELNLLIPFFTNTVQHNYYGLSNSIFHPFECSSQKFSKEANEIFFNNNDGDTEAKIVRLYNYSTPDNILDKEFEFEEAINHYIFTINDIRLYAFEKGINFMLMHIILHSVNNIPPTLDDLTDFSSLICKVRDGIKRFGAYSFREILSSLIGSYNPVYIGNNLPKLIEEKPKVLGYACIETNKEISLDKLNQLVNNQGSDYKIESSQIDTRHYRLNENDYMAIAKNGLFFLKKSSEGMLYWNEYIFAYLLNLYEYYVTQNFIEKITIKNFNFSDNKTAESLEKIINIRKEYTLFKVGTINEYTKIDSVNADIEIIKSYFDKDKLNEKFEKKLKDLNEVAEVLEKKMTINANKEKEAKSKKIEIAAVLITSIIMFFSIIDGIFKLFERLASVGDNIFNIVKIMLAVVIWFIVIFATVKKVKK